MPRMADFRNCHAGGAIIVCGCGSSLNLLTHPADFTTIGVNDVGRLFDPDYLVVVDPRQQFKGDRFAYVEASRAGYLFTQRSDLELTHPNVVTFRLGSKEGTDLADPDVLHYSVITPYVALCLAIQMGATRIGLLGVDFTDHHFFGSTGTHGWTPHVATINRQFRSLGTMALARGVRIFNLSPVSRITAFAPLPLAEFARADAAPLPPAPALRIACQPGAGTADAAAALARCINARSTGYARCTAAPAADEVVLCPQRQGDAVLWHIGASHVPASLPVPLPWWEARHQPGASPAVVTIAHATPPSHHYPWGSQPRSPRAATIAADAILGQLAAAHGDALAVLPAGAVDNERVVPPIPPAHILVDSTGAADAGAALAGLAAGCVVVWVGAAAPLADASADTPLLMADATNLHQVLELLIGLGPDALATLGAAGRRWVRHHCDFGRQWQDDWLPALRAAGAIPAPD